MQRRLDRSRGIEDERYESNCFQQTGKSMLSMQRRARSILVAALEGVVESGRAVDFARYKYDDSHR